MTRSEEFEAYRSAAQKVHELWAEAVNTSVRSVAEKLDSIYAYLMTQAQQIAFQILK